MPRYHLRTSVNTAVFVFNVICLIFILRHSNDRWSSLEAGEDTGEEMYDTGETEDKLDVDGLVGEEAIAPIGMIQAAEWNHDWDGLSGAAEEASRLRPKQPTRRLYLIRHGHYHGSGPNQGHLSDKGKLQTEHLGARLKNLTLKFESFISSSSKRARETTEILQKYITQPEPKYTDLLKEGRPTYPDPIFPSNWKPDEPEFKTDGVRLDLAYRKMMRRLVDLDGPDHVVPDESHHQTSRGDKEDIRNELIVCHGNVIAYFVLRTLQLPPERWLKVSIFQGSLTILDILPNGQPSLKMLGDAGHLTKDLWTG